MSRSGAQGCLFCDIIHHKREQHLKSNEKAVIIADIKPQAPHHYLVLARSHIRQPGHLTHADIDLVKSMEALGREYLRDMLKAKGESDTVEDLLRIGFHWPPLIKVQHLHMHLIYPSNQMGMIARSVLFRPSRYFRTAQSVLMELEKQRGGHPVAIGEKVVNGLEAANPVAQKCEEMEKNDKHHKKEKEHAEEEATHDKNPDQSEAEAVAQKTVEA